MSKYSEFEIMARAKEDVFLSANCECLSMFESFFAYNTLKDASSEKFNDCRKELQEDSGYIRKQLDKIIKVLEKTELYDELPEAPSMSIADLSYGDALTYYKSKAIVLEREFASANRVYLYLILPFIYKLLKMHVTPEMFLGNKGTLHLEKILKRHQSNKKGGKTLHEKVAKRADQEKKELLTIYDRIKEEEEYKGHPKKTKHAALLEFCLKTGIIAKSVEMEISSLQCASSDKDKKLLQTFQNLKQTLENSKTSDASSFFTPDPSLKGFKQKMLRQIRQRLNTAELFR